jgi:CPA1 family monovalent cation:H+ antiporter
MTTGALLTALLATIIALALVAKKLGIPYPVVFVIGGALLALVPGIPTITLAPDLVFLLFLPPLIFGDGWTTDVRTFLRYRGPILWLAIGLVLFTSVCVAYAAHWLIGVPLALGYVLGAILSPTDAVATDAIAEELNMPRRLTAILSGESLVNDASGLVIYAFAVTAVLTGTFSLGSAVLQFVYVVVVGIAIGIGGGILLGRVLTWIRTSGLSDELISVSFSLVTPFALYVPADALHASGVLAALSGGMILSRKSNQIFDADSRIAGGAVWSLLFFTFNGAAFVLIGLQLRSIAHALSAYSAWTLVGWSLGISAVVVLARYFWVFEAERLRRLIAPRLDEREGPKPRWQVMFIAGTAGMRGVVSLAAALALPLNFPRRDLILFIVFVVILVTLVGQGLLMPILIRRWNVVETGDATARGLVLAGLRLAEAASARLRELQPSYGSPAAREALERLSARYDQRIVHFQAQADGTLDADLDASQHDIEARLRREAHRAERHALAELRRSGAITDDAYRQVEWQIDLAESRLD